MKAARIAGSGPWNLCLPKARTKMATLSKRVWWLDDSDPVLCASKLDSVRGKQTEGWEWLRFNEEFYPTPEAAFKDLFDLLLGQSMFCPGKAIQCNGVPLKGQTELHHKLSDALRLIPESVLFIIVARPDKGGVLYKAFKEMEKRGLGSADDAFELTYANAVEWITLRAKGMGAEIDKKACQVLADLMDFNPVAICSELRKLKHLAPERKISERIVEMGCSGKGETDIMSLGSLILSGRAAAAHELVQRLLDKGEPPIKICGWIQDWLGKTTLAESVGCNSDVLKTTVADARKWKANAADDDENVKYERIISDRWGIFTRREGEGLAMFPNSNALWHACKNLGDSAMPSGWAHGALDKLGKLQLALRNKHGEPSALMHLFVVEIMPEKRA